MTPAWCVHDEYVEVRADSLSWLIRRCRNCDAWTASCVGQPAPLPPCQVGETQRGEVEVLRRALELACADYDYSLSGYDDYIEFARRLLADENYSRLVSLGVEPAPEVE